MSQLDNMFLPPEPVDMMREGLPNLRHGTIHTHPLEQKLKEQVLNKNKNEYEMTAALFGFGFADHLKVEREIIQKSRVAYTGYKFPTTLGLELHDGTIDDLDYEDMFAPNGMSSNLRIDVVEVQEKRNLV